VTTTNKKSVLFYIPSALIVCDILCSSLGQGLLTSTFVGEIMFAIVVATLGLILFALLIGNMQVSVHKLSLLAYCCLICICQPLISLLMS